MAHTRRRRPAYSLRRSTSRDTVTPPRIRTWVLRAWMPTDPEQAIQAILAAVKSGRLSRKRIDQSLAKILNAKARVGLARSRVVDLDKISDVLDNEDAQAQAQRVADEALTLVRNDNGA